MDPSPAACARNFYTISDAAGSELSGLIANEFSPVGLDGVSSYAA